ncbi:MAG: TapB family protein [Lewinella sp.]|jgi:hypothetical protein|uniref:TapB family protein n=1 Tax=Lewinella sp. TaxID=2004506 RepID=UPI003D6BAF60
MKTKLSLFTLLLLSVLLFPACNDDDENIIPPPDASDYFPLEVGAFWVYESYKVENGEEVLTGMDTMTVINSYQDGEDVVYEIEKSTGFIFKSIIPDSYRLSNGILYAEGDDNSIPTLNASLSGDVIYTDTVAANLGFIDYIFYDELTTVETPAGVFDCINVQGTVTATDTTDLIHNKLINTYYAEGVGIVRFNNYWWNSAQEVGFRLSSFELP